MASILRFLPRLSRRWEPITLSSSNFTRVSATQKIEEETIPEYVASHYYPVRLGEIFRDRYQIVGKLGFGTTSTVWLARDLLSVPFSYHSCLLNFRRPHHLTLYTTLLSGRRHVTLKLFINSKEMGDHLDNELHMFKRIEAGSKRHEGRSALRSLLDSFEVDGPDGQHRCLVHAPLWESVWDFLHRNPAKRLPPVVLALLLHRTFMALDYLHTECQIIHTGMYTVS